MIFTAVPVRLAPNGGSLYRFPVSYSSFSSPNIRLLGYHITFWPFVNYILSVFPPKMQLFPQQEEPAERSRAFPGKTGPAERRDR